MLKFKHANLFFLDSFIRDAWFNQGPRATSKAIYTSFHYKGNAPFKKLTGG